MNEIIGALLPLGVAAMMSPMPLIALIIALLSRRRVANGVCFVSGALIATVALTVVAILIGSALPGDAGATSHPVAGVLRMIFGAALLVFAMITWRGRPRSGDPHRTPSWMTRIDGMGPAGALGFGALLTAANVKNLPITLVAGTHIAEADTAAVQVVCGIVFIVISCLAMIALLAAALLFPARTGAPLQRLRDTLSAHNAVILTVVFVLTGVSMIGHGIAAF